MQPVTELCQSCSYFVVCLFSKQLLLLHVSEPPIMSYAEKPEDITKEEWMDKLNNVHIQRADMNRLIMNYLVTGEVLMCFMNAKLSSNVISCYLVQYCWFCFINFVLLVC